MSSLSMNIWVRVFYLKSRLNLFLMLNVILARECQSAGSWIHGQDFRKSPPPHVLFHLYMFKLGNDFTIFNFFNPNRIPPLGRCRGFHSLRSLPSKALHAHSTIGQVLLCSLRGEVFNVQKFLTDVRLTIAERDKRPLRRPQNWSDIQ